MTVLGPGSDSGSGGETLNSEAKLKKVRCFVTCGLTKSLVYNKHIVRTPCLHDQRICDSIRLSEIIRKEIRQLISVSKIDQWYLAFQKLQVNAAIKLKFLSILPGDHR
jgi:hypothetical protein